MASSKSSIPDKLAFSPSWSMLSYVCSWHLKLFTRHWREGNLRIILHLHATNSNIFSRSGGPCNQYIESWSLSVIPPYPGSVYCDISPALVFHTTAWQLACRSWRYSKPAHGGSWQDSMSPTFPWNSWYLSSFTSAIADAAACSVQILQRSPSLPMPWPSDDSCLWLSA